jgi:hypothetical protein
VVLSFPGTKLNGGGWRIAIQTSCAANGDNFAAVATSPFHGVNALEVEGWHFDPRVNAPQRVREFEFVLNERDWQMLMTALNSNYDPAKALSGVRKITLGHGTWTITRMARSIGADGKSVFRWIDFRLSLEIKQNGTTH